MSHVFSQQPLLSGATGRDETKTSIYILKSRQHSSHAGRWQTTSGMCRAAPTKHGLQSADETAGFVWRVTKPDDNGQRRIISLLNSVGEATLKLYKLVGGMTKILWCESFYITIQLFFVGNSTSKCFIYYEMKCSDIQCLIIQWLKCFIKTEIQKWTQTNRLLVTYGKYDISAQTALHYETQCKKH